MRRIRCAGALLVGAVLFAGCSSSSTTATTSTSTTTPPTSSAAGTSTTVNPAQLLTILVTNDDGYSAPGIDALVKALNALPDVKVTVVAPLTNESGTGGKTTPGTLTAFPEKTASGYPATAVKGYPADAVAYALAKVFTTGKPDLVVSGVNNGQNTGPTAQLSGTVGAAQAGAAAGIPAVAASQGSGNPPTFSVAATAVTAWVQNHHDALVAKTVSPIDVVNINAPTCKSGTVRGVASVPVSVRPLGPDYNEQDCTSTKPAGADDIAAFAVGFITVTELTPQDATVTSTTVFPKLG
jgi:5'-nucleotidase